MFEELAPRFLLGGIVVCVFSALGSLFKPNSFAGLFGAAPSVALATLALTIAKHGSSYASIEARSMLAGAVALCCYSVAVVLLLEKYGASALRATLLSLPVWFGSAFGIWFVFLK